MRHWKITNFIIIAFTIARPAAALNTGADFLRAEVAARPGALGGAFAGFSDDAHAFLWNPSALAGITEPMIGATHFSTFADTAFDQAVFLQPIHVRSLKSAAGVSVQYSSTARFVETDLQGREVGAVDNYDLLVDLGYGLKVTDTLNLGLNMKTFNSRLAEYRSRGFAADLGMQSRINSRMDLGVSLMELGWQEAFDQEADPLPSLLRLGVRAMLLKTYEVTIIGCAELDRPWNTADAVLLGLGLEYWYRDLIAFRAGYRVGADVGNLAMGVGFRWKGLGLDYAYIAMGDLGLAHRTSLTLKLGTLFEKARQLLPSFEEAQEREKPPRVIVDPDERW